VVGPETTLRGLEYVLGTHPASVDGFGRGCAQQGERLRQQSRGLLEYVVNLAPTWIFVVHAVRDLLK
jgi:hypothetical protein